MQRFRPVSVQLRCHPLQPPLRLCRPPLLPGGCSAAALLSRTSPLLPRRFISSSTPSTSVSSSAPSLSLEPAGSDRGHEGRQAEVTHASSPPIARTATPSPASPSSTSAVPTPSSSASPSLSSQPPSPPTSSPVVSPRSPLPPPSSPSSASPASPPPPSSSSSSSTSSAASAPLYDVVSEVTRHFMHALHLSEQNRLVKGVAVGLSLLTLALLSAYMFRDSVKTSTAEQVADVAKRSLADSDVQQQVNSLSQEVVHRLLTDPAVLSTALAFTTRLLHEPSTQQALSGLLSRLLHDPATLQQAHDFSTQLVHSLTSSEQVQRLTAELVKGAIAQADNKTQLIALLQSVVNDERSLLELRKVGSASAHDVLNDRSVQEHMTAFVKQCLADHSLQQTAGEALWGAVRYSFRPKWGNGRADSAASQLPAAPHITPPHTPLASTPTLPHSPPPLDSPAPTDPTMSALHPSTSPSTSHSPALVDSAIRSPHQQGGSARDEVDERAHARLPHHTSQRLPSSSSSSHQHPAQLHSTQQPHHSAEPSVAGAAAPARPPLPLSPPAAPFGLLVDADDDSAALAPTFTIIVNQQPHTSAA